MTAFFLLLSMLLFSGFLIARSVRLRGWQATVDLAWREPPVTDKDWQGRWDR